MSLLTAPISETKVGEKLIQMGSIYGVLGQDRSIYRGTEMHENVAYATINCGITNLTRQIASYYGQFNVRVNALRPGDSRAMLPEKAPHRTQDWSLSMRKRHH